MYNQFPELPEKWNEWQITEYLGGGSFGNVYKAVKDFDGTDMFCAIKVIQISNDETERIKYNSQDPDRFQSYSEYVQDLISEIRTMTCLRGITNIVTILDYYIDKSEDFNWCLFIQMEFLECLNRYNTDMSENEIIKLGTDICTALSYCSRHNILHRDIKPDNIFISENGDFKLGDFGAAKITTSSAYTRCGTDWYMAPEIYYQTGEYGAQADIYSLGMVLYKYMNASRRYPFVDIDARLPRAISEAREKLKKGIEPIPAPSEASPQLANVILKAIAHNPDARFRDADEFKEALISVNNTNFVKTQNTGSLEHSSFQAKGKAIKKSVLIPIIGFVAAAAIAVGIVLIINGTKTKTSQSKSVINTTETVTEATTIPEEPVKLEYSGTLKYGDEGSAVTSLQILLIQLGYSAVEINGRFDDATYHAVEDFQTTFSMTATGIADKDTIEALNSANTGQTSAVTASTESSTITTTVNNESTETATAATTAGYESGAITWNDIDFSIQRIGENTAVLTVTSHTTDSLYMFGPYSTPGTSPVELTGDDGTISTAEIKTNEFALNNNSDHCFKQDKTYTLALTFDPVITGDWNSVSLHIEHYISTDFQTDYIVDIPLEK